jgi:hypothetical protein
MPPGMNRLACHILNLVPSRAVGCASEVHDGRYSCREWSRLLANESLRGLAGRD